MQQAAELAIAPPQLAGTAVQPLPLLAGVGALAIGAIRLAEDGWRPPLLWLLGLLLGATLYHASFGFTSAYRRMIVARDMRGVQAQLLLLALGTVLFAPVLAAGEVFGQTVGGAWAPVGWSVAAGAFLFGLGMQLAGGCGSGSLYTAGGGSLRMLLVLAAACAGSFWASLHMGWWQRLPSREALVLADVFGWPGAVAIQLAVIGALALLLGRVARPVAQAAPAQTGPRRVLSGPWPLAAGAVLLALGNLGVLLVAGHPWSRFAPRWRMPWRSLAAALLGGLAIGYGARIAYGCNIGAFVSGVASVSLHGWLWIAAALPGTWIGVRLRPLFGLAN